MTHKIQLKLDNTIKRIDGDLSTNFHSYNVAIPESFSILVKTCYDKESSVLWEYQLSKSRQR